MHVVEVSLFAHGLECKSCVRRVLDELRSLEGVIALRVSSTVPVDEYHELPGIVTLKINPEFVTIETLIKTLERQGYPVTEVHTPDGVEFRTPTGQTSP